jgi:TATA-box binding protein (TBP) (component of TFIID and TFIIIB)
MMIKSFSGSLADPSLFHVDAIEDTLGIDPSTPVVVNVVAAMHVLPQEYYNVGKTRKRRFSISLASLSHMLPGTQYQPSKFSSAITRIKDGDKTFTQLWFPSGKVVMVLGGSVYHSLNIAHTSRLFPTNVRILKRNDDDPTKIEEDVLGKYLSLKVSLYQ